MNKLLTTIIMFFLIMANAYAVNMATLVDNNENAVGTSGNPLYTSMSGNQTITGTLTVTKDTTLASVSGNVGIGTTAPTAKLEVAGVIKGTSITISDGVTLSSSSGNVGIGTTSPTSKLEVDGNVYFASAAGVPSAFKLNASDVQTQMNHKVGNGALYFDGVTTSARLVHTFTSSVTIGTSDMTMHTRFMMPPSATSGTQGVSCISSSSTSCSAAGGFAFWISGANAYVWFYKSDSASNYISSTISIANFYNKVCDVVLVKDSVNGTLKWYVDGIQQTATEGTAGTGNVWTAPILGSNNIIGAFTSALLFQGRIYLNRIYNRALSNSDIWQLRERGIAYADEWGTLAPAINYSPATLNGGFETTGTSGGTTWDVPSSTVARSSNVATMTTSIPHGLTSTNTVQITSCTDSTFNTAAGTVATVTGTSTFTYANTGSDTTKADTTCVVLTDVFASWTEAGTAPGRITKDTSDYHSGTASVRFDFTSAGAEDPRVRQSVLTVGKKYYVSAWAKKLNATAVNVYFGDGSAAGRVAPTITTSWAFYSGEFTAYSTQFNLEAAGGNNNSIWVDDFVLTEIGAVLDSDLENADPAKTTIVRDRSSNNHVGTVTSTGVIQVKPNIQQNPTLMYVSPGTSTAGASGTSAVGFTNVAAGTYTDSSTAGSGTAASFGFNNFQQPTLAASNTSVTTTRAATVYIANAPANGTNMTITKPYALWVAAGATSFDGSVAFSLGTAGKASCIAADKRLGVCSSAVDASGNCTCTAF